MTVQDVTTIRWAVDSEGVWLCSMCWDEETTTWLQADPHGGVYCESCNRFVGEEPEWMRIRRLSEALEAIMAITEGSENEQAGKAWLLADAALAAREDARP